MRKSERPRKLDLAFYWFAHHNYFERTLKLQVVACALTKPGIQTILSLFKETPSGGTATARILFLQENRKAEN